MKITISRILIWLIYPLILITVSGAILLKQAKKDNKTETISNMTDSIPVKRVFKIIDIPKELTTPHQRADYLVSHYWDRFDFSDTAFVHLPEVTEQAFVDYLDIFDHADKVKTDASIAAMLDRTAKEDKTGTVYRYFLSLYKSYLYDPNSPMRNEEYYIPVASYILERTTDDEELKSRAAFDLSMMLKNRKGETASDILYTLANGSTGRLYKLAKDYTVLFFHNPDCPACKETTRQLIDSPLINGMLSSGNLAILAIYPDEDITLWRKHTSSIPSLWINAYDREQTVKNKVIYDLKAIPCLYLLDRNKKVLLKDATVLELLAYLSRLPQ